MTKNDADVLTRLAVVESLLADLAGQPVAASNDERVSPRAIAKRFDTSLRSAYRYCRLLEQAGHAAKVDGEWRADPAQVALLRARRWRGGGR